MAKMGESEEGSIPSISPSPASCPPAAGLLALPCPKLSSVWALVGGTELSASFSLHSLPQPSTHHTFKL